MNSKVVTKCENSGPFSWETLDRTSVSHTKGKALGSVKDFTMHTLSDMYAVNFTMLDINNYRLIRKSFNDIET